jgi:hypothetical protein
MKFAYQSEKFSVARSCLMLPHTRGEAESIASAFHECSLGLHQLDLNSVSDDARSWIRRLNEFMDTRGLSDPNKAGLWSIKAESLTTDEQIELSRIVDELANYFHREFWSE